jgi:hypothetical protein
MKGESRLAFNNEGRPSVHLIHQIYNRMTMLQGHAYVWGRIGACPFCENVRWNLFDWEGFRVDGWLLNNDYWVDLG